MEFAEDAFKTLHAAYTAYSRCDGKDQLLVDLLAHLEGPLGCVVLQTRCPLPRAWSLSKTGCRIDAYAAFGAIDLD